METAGNRKELEQVEDEAAQRMECDNHLEQCKNKSLKRENKNKSLKREKMKE